MFLYFVIYPSAGADPSAAQIKAGQKGDSTAATASGSEPANTTGDIEVMQGKLKLLRDRIGFSTITVSFQARGAGAVRDMPLRLPFPWLSNLGLSRLLSLQ